MESNSLIGVTAVFFQRLSLTSQRPEISVVTQSNTSPMLLYPLFIFDTVSKITLRFSFVFIIRFSFISFLHFRIYFLCLFLFFFNTLCFSFPCQFMVSLFFIRLNFWVPLGYVKRNITDICLLVRGGINSHIDVHTNTYIRENARWNAAVAGK